MIIREADFEMEEEEGRWNLSLLKHIGGNNPRDEIQFVGYGYSMVSAIRLIVKNRLALKQEVYSLAEFIKAYKEEVAKLLEYFKNIDGEKSTII
jgi:hypothetical protein